MFGRKNTYRVQEYRLLLSRIFRTDAAALASPTYLKDIMADIKSEETSVNPEIATPGPAAEAALPDSEDLWGHGSAPSLPSVDNEDDHVSMILYSR